MNQKTVVTIIIIILVAVVGFVVAKTAMTRTSDINKGDQYKGFEKDPDNFNYVDEDLASPNPSKEATPIPSATAIITPIPSATSTVSDNLKEPF